MTLITSTSNPRIKQIRKLRERKEREACGCFYIEGLRVVTEAVKMGAEIETLLTSPELLTSDFGIELVEKQRTAGVDVMEVSADVFRSFSHKEGPVGLAAIVRQRWTRLDDVSLKPGDLWVALDSVADPGNLGTILRTNDAVGGKGVILLDQSTDPYDTTAARASTGALFSQRLVRTTFAEFAAWKQAAGVPLIGTSGAAAADYHQTRYPDPMVLISGSERMGLQEHHIRLCDGLVSIPMVGRSDSLNLAVATAVVLYEIFNQRRDRLS
ncbi:MAG: RNA methyltransferase [Anaerolineaceae bacterium]